MKINVRTVQRKEYSLEVDPSSTVLSVKGLLASQGVGEAGCQKLIYKGSVLKDDQTVGVLGISEGEFLVVMVSQPKAAPAAAAPAPAPAPAAAPIPPAVSQAAGSDPAQPALSRPATPGRCREAPGPLRGPSCCCSAC